MKECILLFLMHILIVNSNIYNFIKIKSVYKNKNIVNTMNTMNTMNTINIMNTMNTMNIMNIMNTTFNKLKNNLILNKYENNAIDISLLILEY
jgi:phage-related tail protein